jgi:short-subunit dehydrogenase
MVKQRSGLIVNIGSLAGLRSFPWIGLYSATKAAVHAYTEGLRQELAPFNVKAIVVAPGLVTTKFEGSEWMDGRDTSRYYENLEVGFNSKHVSRTEEGLTPVPRLSDNAGSQEE